MPRAKQKAHDRGIRQPARILDLSELGALTAAFYPSSGDDPIDLSPLPSLLGPPEPESWRPTAWPRAAFEVYQLSTDTVGLSNERRFLLDSQHESQDLILPPQKLILPGPSLVVVSAWQSLAAKILSGSRQLDELD